MASPVDTSVKFFRSTMTGAPVLNGTAGSLISLLDACLVNGFGAQTASSVVVASGVATATFPSTHAAAPESVVLVDGATSLTGLNGEQKITSVSGNTIRWATAEADGTASGTITVRMAPAGWTKVFSGTNLAVYKSASPQAHGQFLRVADTGTTHARVVGYENMTGVSTGTGPFPTNTQLSGGGYWGKSVNASTETVPWLIAADARAFYYNPMFLFPATASHISVAVYVFGDLIPQSQSGDPFATMLQCGVDTGSHTDATLPIYNQSYSNRKYMPRARSGTGTALASEGEFYVTSALNSLSTTLPNPISGRLPFAAFFQRDSNAEFVRSEYPGLSGSFYRGGEKVFQQFGLFKQTGDTRTRLAALSGSFLYDSADLRVLAYDVTGPWR